MRVTAMSIGRLPATLAAALALAVSAAARHSDIVIELDGNRLLTVDGATGVEARVFEGELGELGVPGFADDPGFASEALAPWALLGFNVTDALLFWDGEGFVAPPQEETLDLLVSGMVVMTVTGQSGFQSGPDFAQADSNGHLHAHLGFWVKHPDFDENNPFYNPISDGAYVLIMELTSNLHETSLPLAIVFNQNLDPEDFEAAVEAAADLFGPDCPGDLDGDRSIGLSDLALLLSNYGLSGGAGYEDGDLNGDGNVDLSDLAALLALYGTTCD